MPGPQTWWDEIKDFLGYPDNPDTIDKAKVALEVIFLTASAATAAVIVNAIRQNI